VAKRYDALSAPVLNLIRSIVAAGVAAGRLKSIGFCGELAGRPLEAMALVGLGITSLSMQASSIGPVKIMIRNLDTRELKPLLEKISTGGLQNSRGELGEFAAAHGIPIGRIG
jgi:phosphotransferase system enzyme I (PtsP)